MKYTGHKYKVEEIRGPFSEKILTSKTIKKWSEVKHIVNYSCFLHRQRSRVLSAMCACREDVQVLASV
jgi:hypothetical protein